MINKIQAHKRLSFLINFTANSEIQNLLLKRQVRDLATSLLSQAKEERLQFGSALYIACTYASSNT
jgi:hypothetical protein